MDEAELQRRVIELGPWFHQITLREGIRTRDLAPAPGPEPLDYPKQRYEDLETALPGDVSGARVLDLGCLDGYYSIALARRGAAEVVAMDVWSSAIARVELVKESLGLTQLTPRQASVYDLEPAEDGRFDFVVMVGVLYALDHPLLALQRVAAVTDCLYVSTTVIRDTEHAYMELRRSRGQHGTSGSRYWVPTQACLVAMLETVGFDDLLPVPTDELSHIIYRARRTAEPA